MATSHNSSSYSTGMDGIIVTKEICIEFPPKVIYPGLVAALFEKDKYGKLVDYAAPRLHFQMVLIFVLTQMIHSLLKNLGLPLFISQILAGMILSPMLFSEKYSLVSMSANSVEVLGTMGVMGFVFFLFLSGVKMDFSLTYKSGKKAIWIGLLTVVVPTIFCMTTVKMLHPGGNGFLNKSMFLAVSYSGTSFPVIHCLLSELKILNSELGRLGLAAALIGDIMTLILLMFSIWVKIGIEKGSKYLITDIGMAILFVLLVAGVLRPVMKWMVKHTPETGQIKDIFLFLVIWACMMSPKITGLFRVHIVYGPFILGLAVPDGPPLGSALVERLEPVILGLFLPIFASTCGMRFDPSHLKHRNEFAYHQAIGAVVTLIIKFLVSLVLPILCKMPIRDSLALAFIMISKGIVEFGFFSIMSDTRAISNDIFDHMTIMFILVASIVPILVKRLYDPSRKYLCLQRRTIMNTKLNHELRMIGCIHVPVNVNSIISLLNASCPTKESSIHLDVLHLIKLSGRATPLFIAHQKHKKTLSNKSYSENVVVAFKQFERDNMEAISVNVFTAISPSNLMYEDICNLAMDRLSTFIVLPFHRRWNTNGSIESDDQSVRSLNFDILEKAPCSVGILVEGCRNKKDSIFSDKLSSVSSSSYNIGVIFLGGQDDREALMLAKRFCQDESVSLSVIHLKTTDKLGDILDESDRMLDDVIMSDVKKSVRLTYIEEHVNDGPETSSFLQSIVKDYQLIFVGRRYRSEDSQTSGLQEWCEFYEIGVIGDLLSSSDFIGNYSVLIVQQQQQRA